MSQSPTPQPQERQTNPLAIVSFVSSFFISLVGIICGHIALSQIKKSGGKGRGLALAGTIIGYVSLAASIAVATMVLVAGSLAAANIAETMEAQEQVLLEDSQSGDFGLDVTDEGQLPTGYTTEFCAALMDVANNPGDKSFFSAAAAAESPNQDVYVEISELAASEEQIAPPADMMERFQAAVMEDLQSCFDTSAG